MGEQVIQTAHQAREEASEISDQLSTARELGRTPVADTVIQTDTTEAVESTATPHETPISESLAPNRIKKQSKEFTNKLIRFHFPGYIKQWRTGRFGKLPDDAKLVMSVGQINRPSHSCFDTEDKKKAWILTMVNKGKASKDPLDQDDLSKLVQECHDKEYITSNGAGPHITDTGVKYINSFRTR